MLDRDHYDRARDELACDDPYSDEWETTPTHGLVTEPMPAESAGTPVSTGAHTAADGLGAAGARPDPLLPLGAGSRTTTTNP